MADITTIPLEELEADLEASYEDEMWCTLALATGITEYGDHKSVQDRIDANRKIVGVITAEIERRNKLQEQNNEQSAASV